MKPTQHLLLLGAGHAHLHVLTHLARHPLPGVRVTLVAPKTHQLYSGMVPGFVAGHYALDDCLIPLEPMVRRSGVHWLQRQAVALDANARAVLLDDDSELRFDAMSINTGPVQLRDQLEATLPGARQHGLFVRPLEGFAALWPRVAELGRAKALRVAVVGGGAGGIELALALRHAMPQAAVTLITGGAPVAASHAPAVQQKVAAALKRRAVTVLMDTATGLTPGEVHLASGARLACDVPVMATGAQAPAWLRESGLALDEQGFIAVNACQQSTSHPHVLAAGDVATRMDRSLPRSGVYAVRAGPALAANLAALATGKPLVPHQPSPRALNLLSCGDGRAIASWGGYAAQGRWVWWWKDWIDRGFVRRYRG